MLFCTNCGAQVGPTDVYCGKCGTRQAVTVPPHFQGDFMSRMSARTASMLCYIPLAGWIASIFVLASTRFLKDRNVRFHAFQGLYLFVAWLMVDWVMEPMFHFPRHMGWPMHSMISLMKLTVFGAWVWMIIKTSQEQMFRLPVIGELAERSVAEQR